MSTERKKPTLAAALKYAEKLKQDAEKVTAGDPWVKPYTITPEGVRRLVSRLDGDADAAISHMRERSAMWAREHREQTVVSQGAEERWKQRQARYSRDARERRSRLAPAVRLERALNEARAVSDAPAGVWEAPVRGGDEMGVSRLLGDFFGHCCLKAAVVVEEAVDGARRRDANAA